jgi:hypothetical protein
VKGSGPPAAVVDDTPPTALVGVDETVPPTELLVVSFAVVVVAPLVVVAPEVVVAPPVVVVPFTVVVVAPEVVVAPLVVVVPFTVVVVAPEVVVVPPVVVADASWPTLTPASTIKATAMSLADVRRRSFFTCLAIDPYLLLPRRPSIAALTRTNKTAASFRFSGGRAEQHGATNGSQRLLTGGLEPASFLSAATSVGTWDCGGRCRVRGPPRESAGSAGR